MPNKAGELKTHSIAGQGTKKSNNLMLHGSRDGNSHSLESGPVPLVVREGQTRGRAGTGSGPPEGPSN